MAAFELRERNQKRHDAPALALRHATTGMVAETALLKAIEAGSLFVDTAILHERHHAHPATEALVATLAGTEHDTGLDILKLRYRRVPPRGAQKYQPLKAS